MSGCLNLSNSPISVLLSQHGQNLCFGPGSHHLAGHLAVLHDHQGGNAHDVELGRKLRLFIHVDLPHLEVGPLARDLVHHGPHHPTGFSEWSTSVWKFALLIVITDMDGSSSVFWMLCL